MDLEDAAMGDIPTRPMRGKILYTFDHDNKTNCLARFPDVLNIPVVAIDDSNEVGVIDLKQCLQAIVAASPEIVSRLSDGDFTIYAYDYSEYDTPLVGQGMLSTALVAATPNQQNKTMITGRVCKNMLALFSNGVKETLEVKLRFVPVPKPANDLSKSMDSFRMMSPAVSSGFDPNGWNASVQQTKSIHQTNDYFNFDAASLGGDRDVALVDDIFGLGSGSSGSVSGHQMTGGVGIAETPTDPSFGFNPAFIHSAPGSRAGSPIIGPESSTRNEALRHQNFSGNMLNFATDQSRPGSRASVRSEVSPPTHQRQASAPSLPQQTIQQQTEVYYNEDGQSRKRAKVMQADWQGRSSFGSKSSDLRVTAATAASMHMHRPIAKRPSAPGSNLEPPPRVPTPVPHVNPMLQQQQTQQPGPRRSLLRQASTTESDFMSDVDNYSDAIVSSPEDGSPGNSITAEGTPQEIPSSPPIFTGMDLPEPSSPGLPTLPLPRIADSGYMSERGFNSSNVLDSLECEEARAPDVRDSEPPAPQRPRGRQSRPIVKTEDSATAPTPPPYPIGPQGSDINFELVAPGDMNQLPRKMLLDLPLPPPSRREGSQGPPKVPKPSMATKKPAKVARPAASPSNDMPPAPAPAAAPIPAPVIARTPSEQPHSRRGSLALPPQPILPPSDVPDSSASQKPPPPKRKQSTQRPRHASNESEAGSPAPSDTEGRPKGPGRSGSGAQRRKVIEQRLQQSIENGEMPQYCSHCGAIETPTWRKIYVKECTGKPSPLDSAEGEGETIGVEVTETDEETGDATKFLIRKAMKKTKDTPPGPGFGDIVVCNPCGLWFNKFRTMRPPEKWVRKSGTRKSKKNKDGSIETGPSMSTDGLEPPSEMFYTDQIAPEDTFENEAAPEMEQLDDGDRTLLPCGRPRANSMQAQQGRRGSAQGNWKASQLDAALARAVQSSPVRFHGSQDSPIEIDDLTPKPTRRLLFPSPRREGEVKSLDDNGQVSLKSMPPLNGDAIGKAGLSPKPGMDLNFDDADTNIFEAFTFDKENITPQLDVEHDDLAYLFEGSPSAIFKTPRKTPSKPTPRSHHSLLKTPMASSRKRKPLTPNANAANNANLNANDFMTSPSSNRYWLRSTPSRLERTPGRHSQGGDQMTPFSRQLAQMLSDANDTTAAFTSPSRHFDFSDLPTFTTPGRLLNDADWEGLEGILSSEFASYDNGQGDGSGSIESEGGNEDRD